MFGARLGNWSVYSAAAPVGGGGDAASWVRKRSARRFAKAQSRGQAGARQLHRLRLHELPLDEGQMFTRPEIARGDEELRAGGLYTDGTDAASEANQKLEEDKFQTVAIPFYVLYDADRNVLATFPGPDAQRAGISGVFEFEAAAPGGAVNANASPAPTARLYNGCARRHARSTRWMAPSFPLRTGRAKSWW